MVSNQNLNLFATVLTEKNREKVNPCKFSIKLSAKIAPKREKRKKRERNRDCYPYEGGLVPNPVSGGAHEINSR